MRLGVTGKRDLFVSAAIHRAVVEVNEEGTEAAAATGMVMMLRAAMVVEHPPKLICDHPVRLPAVVIVQICIDVSTSFSTSVLVHRGAITCSATVEVEVRQHFCTPLAHRCC